jgi:hypothetical protein
MELPQKVDETCCICCDSFDDPANPEIVPMPCLCKGTIKMHNTCFSIMSSDKKACPTCKSEWLWDDTNLVHMAYMYKRGLVSREKIQEVLKSSTASNISDLRMLIVKTEPMFLEYIEEQTHELCLAAVQLDGAALSVCSILDYDICLAAVRANPSVLVTIIYFIFRFKVALDKAQIVALCIEAIKQNPNVFTEYIMTFSFDGVSFKSNTQILDALMEHHPNEIATLSRKIGIPYSAALIAVRKNGELIQHVHRSFYTRELCMTAVRSRGTALQYIDASLQTADMCMAAVNSSGGTAIYWSAHRTPAICRKAVQLNGKMIAYVPTAYLTADLILLAAKTTTPIIIKNSVGDANLTVEDCMHLVRENPAFLEILKARQQTFEVCMAAISADSMAFQFVKHPTDELCLAAVKVAGSLLRYIKRQTTEMCMAAVKADGMVLQYVRDKTPEICEEAIRQNSAAAEFVPVEQVPTVRPTGFFCGIKRILPWQGSYVEVR